MFYIINGQIIYDDAQYSVISAETYDKILLPATAARLLSLLIKHHGSTLSRAEILDYVWDKYGFKASNNTLTQYISLLRKNFQALGSQSEIITTIPRTGFLMPADVDVKALVNIDIKDDAPPIVEKKTEEFDSSATPQQDEKSAAVLSSADTDSTQRFLSDKPAKNVGFHFLNGLSVILACLICYLALKSITEIQTATVYETGMIDSCPVYMFYKSSNELLPARISATEKLARQLLPCKTNTFYFTQQEDSLAFGDSGRIFLSRCAYQAGSHNRLSSCKSIFFHEK